MAPACRATSRPPWNKISVVTMMCTFTELTVLLEQPYTGSAYAILSQIVSH